MDAVMDRQVVSVTVDTDQEEVARSSGNTISSLCP